MDVYGKECAEMKKPPLLLVWEDDEYHPIFLGVFASIKAFLKAYVANVAKRETFSLTRYRISRTEKKGTRCHATFSCAGEQGKIKLTTVFQFEEAKINKIL